MTIHKAAPAVVTAPATRTLTYTGSAQKLVEAGSADAGTLYYAVTTENQAPADDLYSTSIPEGTHAGTYYVWYKVKGDASHTDTEPVCIQVTISEGGTYAYISGDGDTWTKSSGLPLTFRVKNSGDDSETYGKFAGLQVDGKQLTSDKEYVDLYN